MPWLDPKTEAAAPAISRLGGPKPAIVLLLAASDEKVCHAVNFERVIFRDQSIVELAKSNFVTVRVDRGTEPAKLFEAKGPEIIIQSSEGDEVARFNDCTNPKMVLGIMREAVKWSEESARNSAKWAPHMPRLEKLYDDGKNREACEMIGRVRKDRISRFLRDKVASLTKSLEERAQQKLDEAKAKDEGGDPAEAWTLCRDVRDEFVGLAAEKTAKAQMAALEKDPAKKDRVREAMSKPRPTKPAEKPAGAPSSE